ncbi:MAG: type II toxin-antitoxin system VapC family toxin [Chloroflexota bacterium]|nr:type II toxin-antitoxin system VapC family toxin [Chloroflexota bacterium]
MLARLREAEAIVPAVWSLEVVNTLLIGERRGRVPSADIAVFVNLLQMLRIELEPASSLAAAVGPVREIGRVHGLSSYDASYVELALRRRLPLAALDARMRAAAVDLSVSLVAGPIDGAGDASSSVG